MDETTSTECDQATLNSNSLREHMGSKLLLAHQKGMASWNTIGANTNAYISNAYSEEDSGDLMAQLEAECDAAASEISSCVQELVTLRQLADFNSRLRYNGLDRLQVKEDDERCGSIKEMKNAALQYLNKHSNYLAEKERRAQDGYVPIEHQFLERAIPGVSLYSIEHVDFIKPETMTSYCFFPKYTGASSQDPASMIPGEEYVILNHRSEAH